MGRFIGLRVLKTSIGATLAIILAKAIGLQYAVSAGVITILSIQNTKKKSITLAFQRFESTVMALGIAAILFTVFGYNAISFGVFLLIFIPFTVKFNLTDGIVVSSVLVTHLLVEESISFYWMKNEILLMAVGAGIGILLNAYMPKIEGEIKEDQRYIEDSIRKILLNMAHTLRSHSVYIDEEKTFQDLEKRLEKANERARQHLDNYIMHEVKYYVQYMEMRTTQFTILEHMRKHIVKFEMTPTQTEIVASFAEKIALELHEYNSAEELLEEFKLVLEACRIQELPKTREEFESRAILFQFLNDLEYLLEVKRDFKNNLDREEIGYFWPNEK